MDSIITKVSKITNVKKSRIHNVINKNLDKIEDPANIYKFAAYQCKGIINTVGLCWGISLIQFISPISEDIEIDNILSVLNKYCYRYGTGGTRDDERKFLYNFTEEVKKIDPRLLGFYSDLETRILNLGYHNALKLQVSNIFSEQNVIFIGQNIAKYIKFRSNNKNYEPYSILIYMKDYNENKNLAHSICLRVCNKTLFLFDNDNAYKISSFNLSNVMDDPRIILTANTKLFDNVHYFNKEKVIIQIRGVLLKHKRHHSCLEKISKKYNVDEIYVNNLV